MPFMKPLLPLSRPTILLVMHTVSCLQVADVLVELADSFVESAIRFGSQLAKHRGDDTLTVRDIRLYLDRTYNLKVDRLNLLAQLSDGTGNPSSRKGLGGRIWSFEEHQLSYRFLGNQAVYVGP